MKMLNKYHQPIILDFEAYINKRINISIHYISILFANYYNLDIFDDHIRLIKFMKIAFSITFISLSCRVMTFNHSLIF